MSHAGNQSRGISQRDSRLPPYAWFLYLTPAAVTYVWNGWLALWGKTVFCGRCRGSCGAWKKKFSRWHKAQWCSNEFLCHLSIIKISCLGTAPLWHRIVSESLNQTKVWSVCEMLIVESRTDFSFSLKPINHDCKLRIISPTAWICSIFFQDITWPVCFYFCSSRCFFFPDTTSVNLQIHSVVFITSEHFQCSYWRSSALLRGISLVLLSNRWGRRKNFLTYRLGAKKKKWVRGGFLACPLMTGALVSFLETWTHVKDKFLKFQLRPESESPM